MIPHTITLQTGTAVDFRLLQPRDVEPLLAMHHRTSQTSLANRYLLPYLPTRQEVADICEMESGRGAAYVATVNQAIVGLGYYMIDGQVTTTAETAFLVQDDFQRHGIGHKLFQLLAQHALTHQVAVFNAYVLATNVPMLRIFRRAGFPFKAKVSYGTLEVHLDLTAPQWSPTRSN